MQLDFSAIRGDTALDMAAEAHIKPTEQPLAIKRGYTQEEEKELDLSQFRAITEAPRKQEQAAGLAIFYQREQQELDRAREVYKSYQNNIRAAGNLRADILKGLRAGEAAEDLLLKACKTISLMTGDTVFNKQAEQDLIAIYGEGLGAEKPLEYKLNQVQKRLKNMQQAIERGLEPDDKRRVKAAIAAHEAEVKRIQSLLDRQ